MNDSRFSPANDDTQDDDAFLERELGLSARGVELVRMEGGKHGDFGKDPAMVNARVMAFLRKHLF